jgi:hypothetical protein
MLFLFGVGGGLETVLAAVDEATLPKTGELVDVGGRRLHVECKGTGAPTVVFESGLGLSSAYWGRIAPTIARTTRVCVYDCAAAAGATRCPPRRMEVPSRTISTDVFAAKYRNEVAGMVLLDAQPMRSPRCPTTARRTARSVSLRASFHRWRASAWLA